MEIKLILTEFRLMQAGQFVSDLQGSEPVSQLKEHYWAKEHEVPTQHEFHT